MQVIEVAAAMTPRMPSKRPGAALWCSAWGHNGEGIPSEITAQDSLLFQAQGAAQSMRAAKHFPDLLFP